MYKMVCMECGEDYVRDCKAADYDSKVYCSNCNDYVGLWKVEIEDE